MNHHWQERPRPARLERRFEFENYAALSDFLDSAAGISEREGLYPDISFGRDYVNITIHADESSSALEESQRRFAAMLDELRAAGLPE